MPLSMMEIGGRARVIDITGDDSVRRRLGALGFVVGMVVTVIQNRGGSRILGVHDSRVAIGDDLARRLMVRPV